jgi:hypothetical protein
MEIHARVIPQPGQGISVTEWNRQGIKLISAIAFGLQMVKLATIRKAKNSQAKSVSLNIGSFTVKLVNLGLLNRYRDNL